MKALGFAACALVAACTGGVDRAENTLPIIEIERPMATQLADVEPVNWADPRLRPEPYRWDWRYTRIEEWEGMPREIQHILQRYSKENSLCRGGSGSNRSTMRACNRRQDVGTQLEKLGWCWGGADTEAFKFWLRCADDQDRAHRDLSRVNPAHFSQSEINWAYEDERGMAHSIEGRRAEHRLP